MDSSETQPKENIIKAPGSGVLQLGSSSGFINQVDVSKLYSLSSLSFCLSKMGFHIMNNQEDLSESLCNTWVI